MKSEQSNSVRPKAFLINLDEIDFAILDALQNNARLSNKELAARVGLAPSSCLARFRKLTRYKVIQGFYADLNLAALGIGVQAIIAVRMARHSRDQFRTLYSYTKRMPEVLQVFQVSGEKDLLIHVAVADVEHLRDLIFDRLATRTEVASCETSVIFSLFRQSRVPQGLLR